MYMTVLKANYETLQKQKIYMDFYDMNHIHKWLTSQFQKSRSEEKILFKLQFEKNEMFFYIQSEHEFPTKGIEKAGMMLINSFAIPETKTGDLIMFKLHCTPSRKIEGKDVYLKTQESREQWLDKRLSRCLEDIQLREIGITSTSIGKEKLGKNKRKTGVNVRGAEYIGIGRVADSNILSQLVQNGIGKCKNYGFGLLLYKVVA